MTEEWIRCNDVMVGLRIKVLEDNLRAGVSCIARDMLGADAYRELCGQM